MQDNIVMDAVTFLDQASIVGDEFRVTDLPESPTGIYTATVTDFKGNTSELSIICSNRAIAVVNNPMLEFGPVSAKRKPRRKPVSFEFTIKNVGCAPLTNLTTASISRLLDGAGLPEKEGIFSINPVKPMTTFPLTINPDVTQSFLVKFNPVFPRSVLTSSPELPAPDNALPVEVFSELTLQSDIGPITVGLIGRVKPGVHLIDPQNPRKSQW